MKSLDRIKLNGIISKINSYENDCAPSNLFVELSKLAKTLPNEVSNNLLEYGYLMDMDYTKYSSYIFSIISTEIPNNYQKILFENYILASPFDVVCYPHYDPGYICLAISKLKTSEEIPNLFIKLVKTIDWQFYEKFPQPNNRIDSNNRNIITNRFWEFAEDTLSKDTEIDEINSFNNVYSEVDDFGATLLASIVLIFKYQWYLWKKNDCSGHKDVEEFYSLVKKLWYQSSSPKIQSVAAYMMGIIGYKIGESAVKDLLKGLRSKNVDVIFSICDSISTIGLPHSKQAIAELSDFLNRDFADTSYHDGIVTATDPFYIKKMLFPKIADCLSKLRPASDEVAIPILLELVKENSDNVLGWQLAISLIAFDLPTSNDLIPVLINAADSPFIMDELILTLAECKPSFIGKLYDKLYSLRFDEIIISNPKLKINYQEVINFYKFQPK